MNIVMIGTGYVGLSTGLGFASLGHSVACVDNVQKKIAMLDRAQATFFEDGIEQMLRSMLDAGRVIFTTDLSAVINGADIVMIAVQTPPTRGGDADLQYVNTAIDQIAEHLEKEIILVIKSTVPVGTNRAALKRLQAKLSELGKDDLSTLVQIASLPEFSSQGTALSDFLNPDRIVIGADDAVVFSMLEKIHQGIDSPILKTSIESAELIKSASNSFLATKISYINAIANVCEQTGADVREVAKGVGLDSRIGNKFFRAGIGYGGSCFPKDVSALFHLAGVNGYDFHLLKSVTSINKQMRVDFFNKVLSRLGSLKGIRIGVWGLAFKPFTDDVRDSAALDIVRMLVSHGADVCAYDPQARTTAQRELPDCVSFTNTPIDAARGADALLVLTEWPEFLEVSLDTLKIEMIEPIIFDGRNMFADMDLQSLGFEYHGVGVCGSRTY